MEEERTLFLSIVEEQITAGQGIQEEDLERQFVEKFHQVGRSAVPTPLDSALGSMYLTGLVGVRFETDMVIKSSPKNLLEAGLLASKDPVSQRRIICGPVFDRADGISLLYRMIVDNCKFEICHFFNTLLETATFPVAYFCNHGKDRTGLMTAFIQALCGVDHQTIFDSYCLSDFFLHRIKQIVDREMVDGGLTPAIMSRTPRTAMQETFEYLQQLHGGIPEYLTHIGFPLPKQQALRDRLVIWDSE